MNIGPGIGKARGGLPAWSTRAPDSRQRSQPHRRSAASWVNAGYYELVPCAERGNGRVSASDARRDRSPRLGPFSLDVLAPRAAHRSGRSCVQLVNLANISPHTWSHVLSWRNRSRWKVSCATERMPVSVPPCRRTTSFSSLSSVVRHPSGTRQHPRHRGIDQRVGLHQIHARPAERLGEVDLGKGAEQRFSGAVSDVDHQPCAARSRQICRESSALRRWASACRPRTGHRRASAPWRPRR